jgi:quercetin dioxygenase-like cupin family protein
MEIKNFSDMKKGWFIGDFEPTAYKTDQFEVSYRTHPKGEVWETHYHKIATEINLLVKGEMILQGRRLKSGDIFILYPYEIADPDFLEDCTVLCVKMPSVPNDKFEVEEEQ